MDLKISSAIISVFDKVGLEPIVRKMHDLNIVMYSTGGTRDFIENLGLPVIAVESITGYPSILGGRVKTLHPKVFGGILNRKNNVQDAAELIVYDIPTFDCVIVDLYPFEQTVASGASHDDVVEKIDIGGISLIRAAAKNYSDVVIIPSINHYAQLLNILVDQKGITNLSQRKALARGAFDVSSHYDSKIYSYFLSDEIGTLKVSEQQSHKLRYGENPHQHGMFYGDLDALFLKKNGKELSYNNLLDVDAAVMLIDEFDAPTFAILKHNNACGIATRNTIYEAFADALACDPVSAFGGILIANREIDLRTAENIHKLFYEVVIAPSFSEAALSLLAEKESRIILVRNKITLPKTQMRTLLNGILYQDKDVKTESIDDLKLMTIASATDEQLGDLIFANKIAKHTKSNTIVIAKNKQLIASGTGQTSRVDALKQAIEKARAFHFDLTNAAMASDAFFPFPDCVQIAHEAGIVAVVQPGGSIKDQLSIDYCNKNNIAMYCTGVRHFKH